MNTKIPSQISRKTRLQRCLQRGLQLLTLSSFCIATSLTVVEVAHAQNSLTIPKAKQRPVLADYVNELPLEHGVEVKDFRQYRPGNGTPSSRDTKAYLSYDDNYFYAVFVAKADPKSVRAHIAKRENIMGDDEVVLELDTFHDKQRSFIFHVNPYGVQFDGRRTEGQGSDYNFDTQWESDGQITESGFVTMMAIPFKSLRFKADDVQHWGIAVGSIIGGVNEWSFWPTISNQKAGFVPQMADISIPVKLTPGRNIQFIPSLYSGSSKILNQTDSEHPFWQNENKSRVGLDAKWVLGEAIALDLTVNPDFSEVESDEPQALVNKRYDTLFPEKRPFFLENAGFFQTPQPLFFSRRIAEPKAGARLTGREGNWSFGSLVMDDTAAGKMLETDDRNYGKKANIVVARLQNDFTKDSNAGILFTDYQLGRTSNRVASTDLLHQFDANWALKAQLAHSQSKAENTNAMSGNLGYLELKHTGRNFNYTAKYLDIGSNFDSTLAFLPRTDIRQISQTTRYVWDIEDSKWFLMAGPQFKGEVTKDHQNKVQDWTAESMLVVNTTYSTDFVFVGQNTYELFDGKQYQKFGYGYKIASDLLPWLSFTIVQGGDELINYAPAKNQVSSLNDAKDLSITLNFKPHSQLKIDETLLVNHLHSRGAMYGQPSNSLIYKDTVFRSKISYQHNRFLGARLIFDYHKLQANPFLSALKPGKRLNTDLQLSYVLDPGTTFYAGYADVKENVALIGNPKILRDTENLNLKTGRNIFVKMNYLFQM
ncbi:MAG: carbohydrate binding family 9 domain-containing protein [Undibacterium sp.]|nr:carbohydrate binding family 9 domain-containing protein [Undibacterium sp.]